MRTTMGVRTARRYAAQFEWPIARGHYASERQLTMPCCCGVGLPLNLSVCSCGSGECSTPGCHPVADDWKNEATADPEAIAPLWGGQQWWPIAPTGVAFDVVVVVGPFPAPVLASRGSKKVRLGLALTWFDDWHAFFVAPGTSDEIAAMERDGVSIRGTGSWIPLPAVALSSPARWISFPKANRGLVLNEAAAVLSMLPPASQSERTEAEDVRR